MITLKNILAVFIANGVTAPVSIAGETIMFEGVPYDVPYKQELIDAGATYDISICSWAYWRNDE